MESAKTGKAGEFELASVLQGHFVGLPPRSPGSLLDDLLLLPDDLF